MSVRLLLRDLDEKYAALETQALSPLAERQLTLRSAWENLRLIAVELRLREIALIGPQRSWYAAQALPPARPARWTFVDQELLSMPWPEGWLLRRRLDREGTVALEGPGAAEGGLVQLANTLPADRAQALTLRFGLDGHGRRTYRDIARALGITRSAASQRVKLALRDLQAVCRR